MKLSKLKMPKKRMEEMGPSEDEMAGLQHGEEMPESDELGAENDMAAEAVADQPAGEPSKLEAVSDDDLVAEVKKRGLVKQLEEGEEEAEESNDEDLV